jgi:RimJ/RimL family protein N-acetyltransferase
MTPATADTIDRYWSSDLGSRPDDLRNPRTVVVPQGTPGYQGVLVFRRGPACIVSVPSVLVEYVTRLVAGRAPAEVFDRDFLASLFEGAVDRIIGPAYLGHADATDFRPADSRGARRLDAGDEPALRRLAASCAPIEWEHSAIHFERPPVFGCFAGEEMAAAGTLRNLDERLLFVGIITHPDYRGHGYGKAVVSAMTEYGIRSGGIMMYRTLSSNYASVGIARSLGYQEYATTLAVRLTALSLPGR